MATDNEMRSAGIHLPGGSDYISLGDDAISANARVLWDRIEGARFDQTAVPLGTSAVFDNLPTNFYTWWSGDVAEALGMPFTAQGTMIMSRWGSSGGIALAASRALEPELWINARLSGGWTGWERIGGAQDPVQQLKAASPAGVKIAPLAMTTGYSGATTSGTGTIAVIQYLPAAVTRLQVHLRNWNPRYINADRAAATLTGVRIGRHTSGGNGTDWVTLPDGKTAYASGWIEVPAALRGSEVVVQYTWAGSDVTKTLGTAWSGGSRTDYPEVWTWLEVEVPASTPVVAAYGSSTAAGVGATRPVIDSWLGQWARAHGAVPAFWAHSGDSASSWTETANRKWELYGDSINAPDAMVYAMGSNDWAGGITATELQDRITATVVELRRRIGGTLYGTTITPRRTPPSNDATRITVNEWMGTSGLFDGMIDMAGAVALPDGTLDPAIDADGTHVTTAGHARLAAAVPATITAQPEPGPEVMSWRDITSYAPNVQSGELLVMRTETQMILVLSELALDATGTVSFTRLPSGLRPITRYVGTWYGALEPTVSGSLNISGGGYFNAYGVQPGVPMSARIVCDFKPGTAFPSPYPGTPD